MSLSRLTQWQRGRESWSWSRGNCLLKAAAELKGRNGSSKGFLLLSQEPTAKVKEGRERAPGPAALPRSVRTFDRELQNFGCILRGKWTRPDSRKCFYFSSPRWEEGKRRSGLCGEEGTWRTTSHGLGTRLVSHGAATRPLRISHLNRPRRGKSRASFGAYICRFRANREKAALGEKK